MDIKQKLEDVITNITTKKDKRTTLDKEIDTVIELMSITSPDTEEYSSMIKNLEALVKIRELGKTKREPFIKAMSPDTIIVGVINIAGILLVLNYEKTDILRSKAFGLIMRGRV